MYHKISWQINIGAYRLGLLDSVEIHKSVDLLADTCIIKLPASVFNYTLNVEDKINPGDKVKVQLGYDDNLKDEFEGYLRRIDTDDGSLILNCEDDLYLLRKPVKDKEFKGVGLKDIVQYVLSETGVALKQNVTLNITYEKFVINAANGYDVLQKLQDETKGNIYIRDGVLNVHPLYTEKHGYVTYSFQQNIESSDLKYRTKEDRRIEVIVENTDAKGKIIEERAGTTGGEKVTIKAGGMTKEGMKQKAENEHRLRSYNGYEGSITGWLIPYVEPGMSAKVIDEDYPKKDGSYYVTAVTTTVSSSGGVRKIQLGIRLN
ncbi:hypothetical protein ABDK00_016880 [Niabella insulamsoli]|uniref:hypothetical protein n=1 Tax=Niabella insulamsoli TaxID=3144874 RepID=UPI0031FE08CA